MAVVAALGGTLAAFHGLNAFAGVSQPHYRPAGQYMVVEKLPKGMVCNALPSTTFGKWTGAEEYKIEYGDTETRQTWDPVPRWQGESMYMSQRKLQADEHRQWYHLDAEGKSLNQISMHIARILRGKDSPLYEGIDGADLGAFVVVTNCEKVRVPGKQYHYKLYFRNLSNRPGHVKVERMKDILNRFPERIIMKEVWQHMPKLPNMRRIFKERLKLFAGPNHLYYNKDPVEYPMHLIKTITPTDNLPKRLQVLEYQKNWIPKLREIKKAKDQIRAVKRLDAYRDFLKGQLALEGDGAAERLELDELAQNAENQRMAAMLEEWDGKPTPKKAVKLYIGTKIKRKKVEIKDPFYKPMGKDNVHVYKNVLNKAKRYMAGNSVDTKDQPKQQWSKADWD